MSICHKCPVILFLAAQTLELKYNITDKNIYYYFEF